MSIRIRVRRTTTPITMAQFRAGTEGGLIAGANVIRNAIRRELRGGYTSSLGNKGDFVTGTSLTHVTIGEPVIEAARSFIRIGTDLLYNLYWELGHHNLFTRHFERDEKWRPAFRASVRHASAAFQRVFRRVVFSA